MWVVLAFLSALFSGFSVIFQKQGMNGKTMQISAMSNTAGLITMVITVCFSGSLAQIGSITGMSWLLTLASGIVQALSWITYFAALKDAQVSAMMALDKVNIVVSMILSFLILNEVITGWMIVGCLLILLGSLLMTGTDPSAAAQPGGRSWVAWAIISPSLQALANVLAKLDTSSADANLISALRTTVVVVVLWLVSLLREGKPDVQKILAGRAGVNLLIGGAMVGISYIFMYQAIHDGINSVVTPIVKTNFLISTVAARVFLHEKIGKKGVLGFVAVSIGVLMFLI